jgi:8-amino-7-oxononanoate synthase
MSEPEPLQQVDRTYVRLGNRRLSYFSGCDYFRLTSHPKVIAALVTGVRKYGLSVAASRMTTGNHRLYFELERTLADFFAAPSALLVSSGYATNLAVAQALAGNFSHALLDERAHPSLCDASRFLDCPLLRFKHRDGADLERAAARCGPGARLILLTDGMFAQDGSVAPLKSYLKILPRDALLLVDDAHGAGVLGQSGRGTLEATGVGHSQIIQTLSFSKAFGTFGGAILGGLAVRRMVLDKSRLFLGSTPLPLPLVQATEASLRLLSYGNTLRSRLARNVSYLRVGLRQAGFHLPETPGPIIPWPDHGPRAASRLKGALLAADIYPPLIRYPGAPATGHFRFVISSEHRLEQLERLLKVLIACQD